jgi:hypothetical protein
VDEGVSKSDPVLGQVLDRVLGRPALVHTEVELLQPERTGDRRLAAGCTPPAASRPTPRAR